MRRAGALLGVALAGLVLAACRHTLPPGESMRPEGDVFHGLATKAQLSDWLATGLPPSCLPAGDGRELCDWRVGEASPRYKELAYRLGTNDRVSVLCVVPADGGPRAADSCTLHQRRSNRNQMRVPGIRGRDEASRSRQIQQRDQAARRTVGGARTLVEMSRALGQLPEHCAPLRPDDALQECQWLLSNRSPGHGSVTRLLGTSTHRKVRFTCRFPRDGGPRAPHSCTGEEPPAS
ncbi:MAG: hypothetical protein ACQGVC_03550 [Myxococcota bacterium]